MINRLPARLYGRARWLATSARQRTLPRQRSRPATSARCRRASNWARTSSPMVTTSMTAVRENLRAGASQIKVIAGGGAAWAYDPLDVTQYTLDEMKAAVEAAEAEYLRHGARVHPARGTSRSRCRREVRRARTAAGREYDEVAGRQGRLAQPAGAGSRAADGSRSDAQKKAQVIDGTDNAFKWARKYGVKLAWGTDYLFDPRQNSRQGADILKLKQWFTPAEILKLVTHDNAQLLALSARAIPIRASSVWWNPARWPTFSSSTVTRWPTSTSSATR